MSKRIQLGDQIFDLSQLSLQGQENFAMLQFSNSRLEEAEAKKAALLRAYNTYVGNLKAEIVKASSGIDLGDLLAD